MMEKIDNEYATQFAPEVKYLKEHGIRYTFVKTVDGTTVWKYKKSMELFECLTDFWKKEVYYK